MYALQNSLPLFMQHRATYPTIDNMERYLQNKQWDGFLKEYTNFQNTLQHSEESNVMIDFIKAHIMEYVQKAIDEILSILYNSGDSLSPEKQSSYINIVIGLGYSHVPELFMLQNSLQGYKNAISGCRERLRKWAAWVWSHEKRVRAGRNRFGPRNGGEKRVVALFAGEAAAGVRGGTDETARGRDPKGEERVRGRGRGGGGSAVQSMLRRVEDLVSVNESINKMLELLHELLKCFQSEVKWVLEKGMNTASMDTLYFSSDDVLALYDLVHLNIRQMCEASFGALARSAAKSNKTTLQQTLEAVQVRFGSSK
ncbi:uncharacterized protein [Blastocystis hominis]|uniref:Uncharacterized protein n=1 Tax=Blastocystis hominis TaxID=12968 RepID=D8M1P2_BLAHO|nr:uncharacterized protein [Blastocystis hominis]CBK21981.2 unnamed protein product [Blastocystis hominis]|eukprot:XP_012896029.1 uncharacterized protein [Blastocystis hominis]